MPLYVPQFGQTWCVGLRALHWGQVIIGGGEMWSWLRRWPRLDELIFFFGSPTMRALYLSESSSCSNTASRANGLDGSTGVSSTSALACLG